MNGFNKLAGSSARRSLRLAAVAAGLVVAVAACSGNSVTARYDAVHPITVETAPQLLELPIGERLSDAEGREVDAFARRFLSGGRGALTIAFPQEREKEAHATLTDVVARLKRGGVPAKRMQRGPYSVEADGDRGLVLSYLASAAYGADCPEVLGDSTRDRSNQTPRYFGCTVQNNLAAMIDRPEDLIEPRAPTPADAERRQRVIERYRQGQDTASSESDRRINTRQ